MSHNMSELADRIRTGGFRLTPQRQIILDTLCAMGGHVTVGELFERVHADFPAIDRSTVYRALDFFGQLGLVCSADVAGATVYEIARAEGPHHHLVCRECGEVAHVPGEAFETLADQLASAHGFAAELDGLTIAGRCRECASAGQA